MKEKPPPQKTWTQRVYRLARTMLYELAYLFYIAHFILGLALIISWTYGFLANKSLTWPLLNVFEAFTRMPMHIIFGCLILYLVLLYQLFSKGILVHRFWNWWSTASSADFKHLMMLGNMDRKFKKLAFLADETNRANPKLTAFEAVLLGWDKLSKDNTNAKHIGELIHVYITHTMIYSADYGQEYTLSKSKVGKCIQVYKPVMAQHRLRKYKTDLLIKYLAKKIRKISNHPCNDIKFWKLFFKLYETDKILRRREACPFRLWNF